MIEAGISLKQPYLFIKNRPKALGGFLLQQRSKKQQTAVLVTVQSLF